MIEFIIFTLPAVTILAAGWMIYDWLQTMEGSSDVPCISDPFSMAEYWDRIERAQLEVLEQKEPVDQTVILWWGLDGLTLDENGDLKWISRKKPEPVNQNIFYQPCQSVLYADNRIFETENMCQSTQAKIDALKAQNTVLQIQAAQQMQNAVLMSQIQSCCAQPYYGKGWQPWTKF